jgi:hypothetical protein
MKLVFLSLITLFLLSFYTQCGNSSQNEAEFENDSVKSTEKSLDEQKDIDEIENFGTKVNIDTNEIILFANMDRFIRSKDSKCVIKGINTSLMDVILLKYIQNQHIDPNKKEENTTDSIFVSLITDEFSFVRKTLSNLTKYDVLSNREENVDEALKSVPAYDWYILKGKFTIKEVKKDIASIEYKGKINQLDAITYHYYGEDAPFNEDEFKDIIHVDLMEAFNDLGKIKKLTKHDLEIVDNKNFKYIRNQFFARKGYIFKTDQMKDYFTKKEWYTPLYEDVSDSLSKIEKYNVNLIKQLEEEVN